MSQNQSAAPATTLSKKQLLILDYLHENVETQMYFKSRCIGEAVDLSSKEVGTNMPALANGDVGLSIEKWGYSSGTTWMITEQKC